MTGSTDLTKMKEIMQTIEQFKDWFVANKFPLRPPFADPIYHTDISTSFVWYRAEPWQVELYLVKPDTVAPVHTHPDFDSIEFYIAGIFRLTNPELDKQNLEPLMKTRPLMAGTSYTDRPSRYHRTLSMAEYLGATAPRSGQYKNGTRV